MNGPHSSGPSTEAAFQPLVDALLVGDHKLAAAVAQHLIEQGCSREQVVTDGLEHAMGLLDDKCTVESFNLLDTDWNDGEFVYPSNFNQGASPSLLPVRHISAGAPRTLMATLTLFI